MAASIYVIGAIPMLVPGGLNPQDATEEFGGDFAVKPVVGAQQPREFVGPADTRLTLSGVIYPIRFAAAGVSDGQSEIAALKTYAASGSPYPVTRGGTMLGSYFVEKVQIKHSFLGVGGTGRRQEFAIQLVQSPNGPAAATLVSLFTGILGTLGGLLGGS